MPMQKCSPSGIYQNLFMTVPDRGFSHQDLQAFLHAWRSDYNFLEIVREPYAAPEAGYEYHYHVGMCFDRRVRPGLALAHDVTR